MIKITNNEEKHVLVKLETKCGNNVISHFIKIIRYYLAILLKYRSGLIINPLKISF